jgi:choloylglycine hydrolase
MKLRCAVFLVVCAVFVGLGLMPESGQSCTTFLLDHGEEVVFGRNYDWMVDDGLVVVNKRGVSKTALTADPHPARWVAEYGSVTFNQYGRELPLGGMNEAGLVVEVMWLDEAEYPGPDSRPAVDNLQWVQYQLDNFRTVEEVLASDSLIRITSGGAGRIHYLVGDRTGSCASVEFIDSALVYHTSNTMEVKALTNDTYKASVEFLKEHEGFGGESPIPGGPGSLERFVRTSKMVAEYEPERAESVAEYAFDILVDVSQDDWTKWSIVYDIGNSRIYFRTFANREIRHVHLDSLDFSCKTPVRVLDINANGAGDIVERMVDYTQEANRNLIGSAFGKTEFLQGTPEEVLDLIASYPESTKCEEQ